MMFISGTGRVRAPAPADGAIQRQLAEVAAACATASETPRIALAPRRDLLGVPSSAIMQRVDLAPGRRTSMPRIAGRDARR